MAPGSPRRAKPTSTGANLKYARGRGTASTTGGSPLASAWGAPGAARDRQAHRGHGQAHGCHGRDHRIAAQDRGEDHRGGQGHRRASADGEAHGRHRSGHAGAGGGAAAPRPGAGHPREPGQPDRRAVGRARAPAHRAGRARAQHRIPADLAGAAGPAGRSLPGPQPRVAVAGHVQIEERGQLALVRIDRPPANALDLELLEDGRRALDDLAAAEPAAVVLTGRDGFFSAGVDLKLAPTLDAEGQRAMVEGINRLFAGWYSLPRPVVAAVNGHAIAGGLILALCADHRVCSASDAKLGLTELRAGIPYPAAAIAVVRAELPASTARRLVLGASLVGPEEALELGVVDELQAPDALLPRALDVATELAALPRSTYTVVKRQLRGPVIEAVEQVLSGGAGDPVLGAWIGGDTRAAAASLLPGGSG